MLSLKNQLCILCILLFSCLPSFAGWEKGQTLPDLENFGLDGALPELEGKVVLVDFWATWCPPCKASFPVMESWYEAFSGDGFVILAVSVDQKEKALTRWIKKDAPPFSVVRDAEQKLVAAAGIEAMPTSFLIDRQGIIRQIHTGFHEDQVEGQKEEIRQLLAE